MLKKVEKASSAFTLVELLVSMVIFLVLMLALASIFSTVNNTWLAGSKQAEVLQAGRSVINQMARDLSSAVLRPDFKTQYLQFVENPDLSAAFATPSIVTGSDTIFWQADLAKFLSTNSKTADHLTVVGYYLADDNSNPPVRSLYRFYAERPIAAPTGTGYNLYQENPANTVPWLTKLTSSNPSPWDGTSSPGEGASVLSTDVIGLWIRCRDVNGFPIPYDQVTNSTGNIKYDASWIGTNSRLPAAVEISIVCLDSQTINRLRSQNIAFPAITAVTDPSDGVTDPADGSNSGSDNYAASIAAFLASPVFKQKGTEIRSFSTTIPLVNGSYAKRYP